MKILPIVLLFDMCFIHYNGACFLLEQIKSEDNIPGVMLDIPSQYMHYCLVLLCYCVRDRDHCCVLCDVARDLLLTWYIVHQPIPSHRSVLNNDWCCVNHRITTTLNEMFFFLCITSLKLIIQDIPICRKHSHWSLISRNKGETTIKIWPDLPV